MGREDWYRNTEWSAATEAAFRAKLARSRSSKPQYLRIQALYLARSHPTVALGLIDEYFETGDEFDVPAAYSVRAEAYKALGKFSDAVASYKCALEWQDEHPQHIAAGGSVLMAMVLEARMSEEYGYALDRLEKRNNVSQ